MKLITDLVTAFHNAADAQKAAAQKAYMKHQFSFLGIAKPVRSPLEKAVFKCHTVTTSQELTDLLRLLWQHDAREFQYAACELAYMYKKLWQPEMLEVFEHMIRTKPWWDTVDDVAANLVGPLIQRYPLLLPMMDAWIGDTHLWIRRTALIFQLRWKANTDTERLFTYCRATMHEKDFFIRKAIGWVLREYSKTDKVSVRAFIDAHRTSLSGLSIKEGSKYI